MLESGSVVSLSLDDFQRMAEASARGLMARYLPGQGLQFVPGTPAMQESAHRFGSQEVRSLSDSLVLIATDVRRFPCSRYETDVRGWLYLHFRLDGSSSEEMPDGVRRRVDGECFALSAFSRSRPLVREMLGSAWRSIDIICRPAFVQQDLRGLGDSLPQELRDFSSGDHVDFWFGGELTSEMRSAIQSLLHTAMPQGIRDVYLRAKVAELVCLALARLQCTDTSMPDLTVRLTQRDVECLKEARRLILAAPTVPSLDSLARRVGLNRNKLAVGFKHVFGVTVGEFDREVRLARARSMLERQALSIGYVATLAGYTDPGSFSKAFKRQYGVLPSELGGVPAAKE